MKEESLSSKIIHHEESDSIAEFHRLEVEDVKEAVLRLKNKAEEYYWEGSEIIDEIFGEELSLSHGGNKEDLK